MFSSQPDYNKLKTNMRLALNRLKLLEKKKSELALKARKEIADYISVNKLERARIRVEHIIREDYLVEAMEIVECFCDLLLARMGLIKQMKTLDEGLAEPISSILWVAPRLEADVAELREISVQLGRKYGKEYVLSCRENSLETVSQTLINKLSVQAPPKMLVEKYMAEIAKNYGVPYEPDPSVMCGELGPDNYLINFNDLSGAGGSSGGGGGSTAPPVLGPPIGFVQPGSVCPPVASTSSAPAPFAPAMPVAPSPPAASYNAPAVNVPLDALNLPDVPSVPSTAPPSTVSTKDEVNFDDLTKRFEALKNRK